MNALLTTLVLALLPLTGCATTTSSSPATADHPANPDAKQASYQGNQNTLVIADNTAKSGAATKAVPYPLDVCIVSDEELGTMGKPVSIVHEGREIKFCCKSCEPQFRKEPQKFLKKLDEAAKKAPAKPAKPSGHEHH